MKIAEQERILENKKKNMLVSASAGSGKTYIMIKYISQLICEERVPLKDFLILTFTKAAATEMKERLQKRLKESGADDFVIEQIDALSTANISTIHAYCEKCLKKYANLLDLNENFTIADENMSQKVRQTAFEKAINRYEIEQTLEFENLMFNYKNDKNKVRDIIFEIETLVNSIADKESFIDENINHSANYFEKALNYLYKQFKLFFQSILAKVEQLHLSDFEAGLRECIFNLLDSKDLFEMTLAAQKTKFPNLPKRKEVGDDVVEALREIRQEFNKKIEQILELNLESQENVNFQKLAVLEKNMLQLLGFYEKEQEILKKNQNLLDFYDLEKFMKRLSTQENLFAGLRFVFVDEYQDTNKVQERIVKNIAKNCNFVAVGDVKQGIYGFRLASSEIFLKDIRDFEKDTNSVVNYLKSNFRSSQKVLDFVNDIFKVCMTKDLTGVDYKESSMLSGKAEFVEDGCKAITIDLVDKKEEDEELLPEIYSVKNAELYTNRKNQNMLFAIAKRISQVLGSKISDNGMLRPCTYKDIAILSRKRDDLFNELEAFLQKMGIPVVSTSRNMLMSEPEIQVLRNYLKLALNLDDDIALVSVLASALYDVNMQEILNEIRQDKCSLCEAIKKSENRKIIAFLENLDKFRKNFLIFGGKKSFFELFEKTNYRAKINLSQNHQKLNLFIDKFIEEISSCGFEFDLPRLINYFETVDISVSSEASEVEDAVLLTTIHNSKGLEYPIVFLIGCDQSLKKTPPKSGVEINEEFGLALKRYDLESNIEIMTVKMRAIKEFQSKKSFVEELMIFYVALTRAKNRIYLFGNSGEFKNYSLSACDSYFDLIFYALNLQTDDYESDSLQICNIRDFDETFFEDEQKDTVAYANDDQLKRIRDYLEFKYKFDELTNFKLKESVTALNKKNIENNLESFSNESFVFTTNAVETGNAYHLALKELNFVEINSFEDLCVQLNKKEIDSELIDKDLLYQNILLLKPFCNNAKVYKEKEFILKDSLKNLLQKVDFEDKILVQGIIDFFAVSEKEVVLIDYKYTNTTDDNYLLNKYINQLRIYKIALEHSLGRKISAVYLLSIKQKKLLKVEI